MIPRHIAAFFLAIGVFLPTSRCVIAQEEVASDHVSCERENRDVIIQAPVIEQSGTIIRATGGLRFLQANKRIEASEGFYDTQTATGELRDAGFTTCEAANPDYRFLARELRFLPNSRVRVRNASFYLGRTKVLTLPVFLFRTGRGVVTRNVFPKPSFDKDDGFGLAQDFKLADSDRFHASADLQVTTKRGLMGSIWTEYGLDGTLGGLPGRFMSYDSLRSSALTMPQIPAGRMPCLEDVRPTGVARLRQFGRFSLKQRTYDIRNTGLVVYRQPELGLTYVLPHINLTGTELDPRLQLYPQVAVSWGLFRESPGNAVLQSRLRLDIAAGLHAFPMGRYAAVQPMVLYGVSAYGNDDTYRMWGYAVEASRLWPNGATVTARYIKRHESGESPFLFDTVDMFREYQGAFQVPIGRYILGFVAGFNRDVERVYDWEVLCGYRTDCLAGWITFHSLTQRFHVEVAIINL
jgi:hypothetical protein